MGHTRDLDRAEAIKSICEAGESRRSLAKEVGCSEAPLRDLLKVANVPLADRVLARRGEISTREFVRRSKAAAKLEAEKAKISEEKRRAKEPEKWSISICDWLQAQGLAWAHQENVIESTRCELIEAERLGTLPKSNCAGRRDPKNNHRSNSPDRIRLGSNSRNLLLHLLACSLDTLCNSKRNCSGCRAFPCSSHDSASQIRINELNLPSDRANIRERAFHP